MHGDAGDRRAPQSEQVAGEPRARDAFQVAVPAAGSCVRRGDGHTEDDAAVTTAAIRQLTQEPPRHRRRTAGGCVCSVRGTVPASWTGVAAGVCGSRRYRTDSTARANRRQNPISGNSGDCHLQATMTLAVEASFRCCLMSSSDLWRQPSPRVSEYHRAEHCDDQLRRKASCEEFRKIAPFDPSPAVWRRHIFREGRGSRLRGTHMHEQATRTPKGSPASPDHAAGAPGRCRGRRRRRTAQRPSSGSPTSPAGHRRRAPRPASGQGDTLAPAEQPPDLDRPIDDPKRRAAHLLRRAGFGGTLAQIDEFSTLSREDAADRLLNYETVDNSALDARVANAGIDLNQPRPGRT